MKGVKFTLPQKYKKIPNTEGLIKWYDDKLKIMTHRQNSLSKKLTNVYVTNIRDMNIRVENYFKESDIVRIS